MSGQPRFTIISAVYEVSRYLPDFIASIEAQDFDLGRVEVIMVDDGSSDDSFAVLQAWAARRPELVTAVTQTNAGQGAARNAGLALATGEWVTFPDPDDIVDPNYLSTVDAFISTHPFTAMVATNRLIWNESLGTTTDTHPLSRFFAYDRHVDLEASETSFHGSAPAAFLRLSVIREHGLEFDERIRPNFEDGHFCSLYLLHCEKPGVGFLGSTSYHYRKRADQSSSLQGSMLDARRYTDVFEYGYLAILESARQLRGEVPRWLQHFLLYEIHGYFSAYQNAQVPVVEEGPVTEAFHRNVAAVLAQLELDYVLPRLEMGTYPHILEALEHGYAEQDWVSDHVHVDAYDPAQRLARVRYYYRGAAPEEIVVNGEIATGPRHAKTRCLEYFGRTLLHERILWVRYHPDLRVKVNGEWAEIRFDIGTGVHTRVSPLRVRRFTGSPSRMDRLRVEKFHPTPTTPEGIKARKLADKPRSKKLYGGAWVVMDRIHDAGDSGEVLFRRLRTHHPEINAWFAIEEDTADYRRLRKEFGKRVIAHGSLPWKALMAHCVHLLSSHADDPIMRPVSIAEFAEARWKFTFLQHGVIKDNLSNWLNWKLIDLFVTSTPAELASIAGDDNAYVFTTKETKLTGLPRFDRLLEVGRRFGPDQRDLVLVAPTWRTWLVGGLEDRTQRREVSEEVLGSEFVQQWLELLRSPELESACREHGLTLAFLPHPNLQPLLPLLDLPAHVQALTYTEGDVQEYFARARVLVTDYSSIAFNAAYLERPVVYFQFDADLVGTGGHVGRAGYFSYAEDGFGPLTATADEATQAVVASLAHGPSPAPEYQARIEATFPHRDGNCSERVIEAVLALRKADNKASGQVPTPVAVPMTEPRTVAVCGSCITRDNFNARFNPDHRRWYSVVAQANQSSMIALMSPPVEPALREEDDLSDYDRWNVASDLSRSFLTELVETQPDYLILDFFGDLHFGLLELPDGRFVTDNRWKLHQTAQYRDWIEAGGTSTLKILRDEERYLALWTEAMDRFAAYVAEHCPRTTVIVHRGFYASKAVTGPTGRPRSLLDVAQLAPLPVKRLNQLWSRLDDHAASTYGWSSIDLTGEGYTSSTEHPWDAFWVHYTLDYYHRFLAELHRVDLGRRLSGDLARAVAVVGEAGQELLEARTAFRRSVVRAQGREIARLERRGVLRTARETLAARKKVRR